MEKGRDTLRPFDNFIFDDNKRHYRLPRPPPPPPEWPPP
jgi:hypothetical protein